MLQPFLAGVLGEQELTTSRRFTDLLARSFVRGTPALAAAGMEALPDQLADALPAGVLHVSTTASPVRVDAVVTDRGIITARAVVIAADPGSDVLAGGHTGPALRRVGDGRPSRVRRAVIRVEPRWKTGPQVHPKRVTDTAG